MFVSFFFPRAVRPVVCGCDAIIPAPNDTSRRFAGIRRRKEWLMAPPVESHDNEATVNEMLNIVYLLVAERNIKIRSRYIFISRYS